MAEEARTTRKRRWWIPVVAVLAIILTPIVLVFGYFNYYEFLAARQSDHVEKVARQEASRIEPDSLYRSKVTGSISCPSEATAGWFGGSSACLGGMNRAYGFTGDKASAQQVLIQALKDNGWASDRSNPPTSLANIIKADSGDVYVIRWELYTREEIQREFTRNDLRPEIRESWRRGYADEKAAFDSSPAIRTVVSIHIDWVTEVDGT